MSRPRAETAATASVSKTSADRAGRALRDYVTGTTRLAADEAFSAYEIVEQYRALHGYPLRKVTVGLRQFVRRETETMNVAQRLKRMDRVVNKLARFPTMRLSQMEDVGGCRAVLRDADEVERVARRIRRR